MPLSDQNKHTVMRYVDAFNRGDIDGLCKLFTADALIYGVLGWGSLDHVRPIWRDIIECFQIKLEIVAMIAEGELVAVRYVERGKSAKSFRGGPVTGRTYEVAAMEWFGLKDGLIRRRRGARDSAAEFRQLGLPLG